MPNYTLDDVKNYLDALEDQAISHYIDAWSPKNEDAINKALEKYKIALHLQSQLEIAKQWDPIMQQVFINGIAHMIETSKTDGQEKRPSMLKNLQPN